MSALNPTNANHNVSAAGSGWASSQRVRLTWERDAFSRMLDQHSVAARDSSDAGSTKEAAHVFPSARAGTDAPVMPAEVDPIEAAADGSEQVETMKPLMEPAGSINVDHAVSASAAAATPPQTVRTPIDSLSEAHGRSEIPRQSNMADQTEHLAWVAVQDEQLHIAVRTLDGEEVLRAKLDMLVTELGWRTASIKINGASCSVKAVVQEQNHGS